MTTRDQRDGLVRARRGVLLLALPAAAAVLAGAVLRPPAFTESWHLAFLTLWTLPVGALGVRLLGDLTGGRWRTAAGPLLAAAIDTLPIIALFAVPLLLGLDVLFPWAVEGSWREDALLRHQRPYLNVPFFVARAGGYFVLWWLLGRLGRLPGPALVVWVLTVTFAAVDWSMSLQPLWSSAIHGGIHVVGCGLSAFLLVALTAALLARRTSGAERFPPQRLQDLGNLVFTFVLLWAYVMFSEWIIIWNGNQAERATYYVARTEGGFGVVGVALIVLHFALPFVVLLFRRAKRAAASLAAIAAFLLALRLVHVFWDVVPAFRAAAAVTLLDVATVVALGALWTAYYLTCLRRRLAPGSPAPAAVPAGRNGAVS